MKMCASCREQKDLGEYSKRSRNKDGLEYSCKSCIKAKLSISIDRRREIDRAKYKKNREYYIAKSSKSQYKKLGKDLPKKFLDVLPATRPAVKTYQDELDRLRCYKAAHKEELRDKNKTWARTPAGKLSSKLRDIARRARKAFLPNDLTKADVQRLYQFQDGKCGGCGEKFSSTLKYEIDHIVPLKLGGETTLANSQLLCRSCNASKGIKIIRFIPKITSLTT